VIYGLIVLSVSAIALFLSAWIVFPSPIFSLLPLSIGAPEVSPYLWGVNILAGLLALRLLQGADRNLPLACLTLGFSSLALVLSLLPISQFPATNQTAQAEMERSLGANYLKAIPSSRRDLMRSQPFVLGDAWRGIPLTNVRYTANIPVAEPEGIPLTVDIYRPPQVGTYPAIVVIHGGAWQGGGSKDNAEFSRYMAARGYVVWAIAYRFAPTHKFPAQIDDVRTALKFIKEHGLEYETDIDRIALLGRSAGSHLAMLAAYNKTSDDLPSIRAVINYYGPVNLTAGYYDVPNPDPIDSRAILRAFLGGTPDQVGDLYKMASPITYIDRPLPPSLLIYGGKDHIVMAKFGKSLAERLKSSGSKAVFLEIPWADHSFDAVFSGISNQLALYYTERFLAFFLTDTILSSH